MKIVKKLKIARKVKIVYEVKIAKEVKIVKADKKGKEVKIVKEVIAFDVLFYVRRLTFCGDVFEV